MTIRTLIPVLLGLIIGLPLGLYYAWEVEPVEYVQTAPQSLRPDYRATYLGLIAQAHAATGDTERAVARLAVFQNADIAQELASLAQREAIPGGSAARAQALARLADEIVQTPAVAQSPSRADGSRAGTASAIPRSTSTIPPTRLATSTARPSATPLPTEMITYTYSLAGRSVTCPGPTSTPEIMVEVTDELGNPVPGVRLTVFWDDGQDRFFTGLHPEIGPGYADFEMEVGVEYALQVEDSPLLLIDISSESCRWENGLYPGSVQLQIERSPADR